MRDASLPLDGAALDLLFRTLELPGARIAGSVLQDHFEESGKLLLASRLLVADGHSQATAPLGNHDDVPGELVWSSELDGLGHFTPTGTIVKVEVERISYFRVDIAAVIGRLMPPAKTAGKRPPAAIVDDTVWEIGDVSVPGRSRPLSLWFARRLYENVEWEKLQRVTRERLASVLRIILTSTAAERIEQRFVRNHLIIPLRRVLRADGELTIDRQMIKAQLDNPHSAVKGPVSHSADYGFVTIGSKTYTFPGPKQRSVVGHLLQAFEAGEAHCLTAEVLFKAEFSNSVNTLAKAFSGRDDWKDFMTEADGRCWAFYNPD